MAAFDDWSVRGDLAVGGALGVAGALTAASLVVGALVVDGIAPRLDNAFALGAPAARWANVYAVSASVAGALSAGAVAAHGAVAPAADAAYALGGAGARWASAHAVAVTATTLAGTLTTAAQPNVTSVGALASLAVNGALAVGGAAAVGGALTVAGNAAPATDAARDLGAAGARWANVYAVNASVAGTLAVAGTLSAATFTVGTLSAQNVVPTADAAFTLGAPALRWADVFAARADVGAVQCGQVVVAADALPAADGAGALGAPARRWGDVHAVTVRGALATAAQPAVTSVGTLTSLACSGPISTTSNIHANGDLSGTTITAADAVMPIAPGAQALGSQLTPWGDVYAVTVRGTLATAAQPAVTSVGTLTSLACSGLVTAASNVHVGGIVSCAALDVTGDVLATLAGAQAIGTPLTPWGDVHAARLHGLLQSGAQPNVVSLGTLTSVASAGAVSAPRFVQTTTLPGANRLQLTAPALAGNAASFCYTFGASALSGDIAAFCTYARDAFNGDTVTVLRGGVWAVAYVRSSDTAESSAAAVNAPAGTPCNSVAVVDVLVGGAHAAGARAVSGGTYAGVLAAGDVIRVHNQTQADADALAAYVRLTPLFA